MSGPSPEPVDASVGGWSTGDSLVALVLLVVGWLTRQHAMPTDGLWADDAWVAVGARAPLADLFVVSTNHPGFTFGLQVVNRVVPDSAEVLAVPTFVAGVATGALLFAVARLLGLGTVASAVGGAAVAVSQPHAVYSGRVKPYAPEVVAIALLAWAVQRWSGRTWTVRTGLLWLVAALACASLGAFGFVAAALATLVVALHPSGDRRIRLVVLGVQGAVQAVAGAVLSGAYDSDQVAHDWETLYDGYIELTDPVGLVRQIARHSARLGQAFVDVPAGVAAVLVWAAVAGLVVAAWRGRRRVAARFLLGLVAVAFVGSFAEQIPFGPTPFDAVFPGARASLWLFPSLAVGLGVAVHEVGRRLGRRSPRAALVWTAAAAVGAAAVVAASFSREVTYGDLGTRSATAFVESRRQDDTVVFFFDGYQYLVASEPPVPFTVEARPSSLHGFVLDLGGGRVPVPPRPTPEQVEAIVGDASEVLVHQAFAGVLEAPREAVGVALEELGFELESVEAFAVNEVDVWVRQ